MDQAAELGDFHALVAVLDPEVVLRVDAASAEAAIEVRGAEDVARRAHAFSRLDLTRQPALVGGLPGLLCTLDGKPYSVMAFTVQRGKIRQIEIVREPARLSELI